MPLQVTKDWVDPESGRTLLGEGNGNLLVYSCLEIPGIELGGLQ